ncbi:MAG: GTP cyclohydrolase IIa [Sulfolobaceae archaeon]
MKVLAIQLLDYKDWTESLGTDREWIIQKTQHEFMKEIHKIAASYNAFPLQLRYDNFIILVDGISKNDIISLTRSIREHLPVEIKTCLGYGETPLDAQSKASECLNRNVVEPLKEYKDELLAALHFDINHNTKSLKHTTIYDSFLEITQTYLHIAKILYEYGGIVQYLGGDNYLGFISSDDVPKFVNEFKDDRLKLGIGIAKNARNAIKLATDALEEIRVNRENRWYIKRE